MPAFETSDLDDVQAVMDSYSVHAIGANEPRTLMEIANFPHWENVYSNILAFQFDTKKVHLVAMTTVPHGRLGGRRRATFESVGAQVPKAEWRGSVLYCLFQEFEDGRAHLVLGLERIPFLKTERPGVVLFCH